ncbi:glycosyltransferase family 4 protein [Hyalangium gracile]|uniref:glycosyltransferase family 4 protein n=1 Tax=Hyalangium gracile TaxID=394092 RepID=UPI0038994F78
MPDRFSVVVLSAKTPDHSHIEKYQGARLLRVPVGSGDLVSRIQTFERAVRRQLDSEEYALAHFTDPFGGYVLCEMKGDYGYRLIYEAQTFPSQELPYTHPQTGGDKRFLAKVRRQELFCLMNADLVITGSQTTRTYIQSLGASTEQIRVIRSPVDLGPYTPDVHGVPDGQPMRLMYLGSQAGWQGLPTLLRALALAIEQGAEVKLTLVGARHPDWQPHLEDLAKELGIQEHVEFQPPVLHDDLVKVLTLADVGVLPMDDVDRNRLQGGPLAKVSEYFAAGRPVLAADLPVTRELLPPAATVFHTAGDARSLAESIVELTKDVPRRLELGREARAFAEQELEAGLIRGKLLDIYDELLGRRTVVGTATELPVPTMTGTPTNRISQVKPPEGGGRRSRGGKSEKGKGSGKKPARDDLPLVLGQVLSDDGMDTRLVKTEPDVRGNEPPVVMGRPLRDQKKRGGGASSDESSGPTPVVRPPAGLRRESEDGPTSIVSARPAQPDEATPQVVRGTLLSESESPPAASASPPTPTKEEEPPAPTPIVPVKTLGGNQTNGSSRPEPSANRAPLPPAPKTGTRGALQEPGREQEPADHHKSADKGADNKGRTTSLPPLTRAPPPPELRGPPPRLEPTSASSPPASPPPEPASPPSLKTASPPETAAPPTPKIPAPPEPGTPPVLRPPPAPEPKTPPALRTSPAPEPTPPPVPRPPPALEPTPPPVLRSPPAPEPGTPPVLKPPPAPEPGTPPVLRPSAEPTTPPVIRVPPPPEPVAFPSHRSAHPSAEGTPPLGQKVPPPLGAAASASHKPSPAPEPATPPPLRPTPPPLRPSGVTPSVSPPPLVARRPVPRKREEEPEELSAEEAQEISDDAALEPTPQHPRPRLEEPEELEEADADAVEAADDDLEEADADAVEAADDDLEEADAAEAVEAADEAVQEVDAAEAVEASDEAVQEVDSAEAVEAPDDQVAQVDDAVEPLGDDPKEPPAPAPPAAAAPVAEAPAAEPPSSALDPWLAQVAHGYCPPEGAQFARHTPPTNFPGRDEQPTDPSRPAASARIQGASGAKSS